MFQVIGKNKMGYLESLILDGKNMSDAMIYANKYFTEVLSVKNINLNNSKHLREEKLSN